MKRLVQWVAQGITSDLQHIGYRQAPSLEIAAANIDSHYHGCDT